MFKKLLAVIVMMGFVLVGSMTVQAQENPQFLSFYGSNSACFMTMLSYYTNDTSPSWVCSKTPAVIVATPYKKFVVFFDFDSASIKADQVKTLEDALAAIKGTKSKTVTLTAFCDFRGSNEYNLNLGKKRAKSVSDWFSNKGINKDFVVVNKGESPIRKLVGKFCESCWNDRRVEVGVK